MRNLSRDLIHISLQDARRLQTDTLGYLMEMVDQHGDLFSIRVGFWDVVVVTHPEHVQYILLDNWRNFSRDTFQFNQFSRVTGQGLLTTTGEFWQRHRRLMAPAFHRHQISGMTEGMWRAVERLAGRWQQGLASTDFIEVDIDRELLRLALEIIGESLFSIDLSDIAAEMSQELLRLMEYVIYRSQNILAPPEWIPSGRNRRFRTRLEQLNRFIEGLICDRRAAQPKADLLGLLLGDNPAVPLLPDQEIRDELVTMIIAGYETVASGMGWIFKLLGSRPDIYHDLTHEIDWTALPGPIPAPPPLLTAVIEETFRLYPPSWLISRRSCDPDQIGDLALPSQTLVVISPYAVHRHPGFWNNPEEFNPDRFLPGSELPHKFAYIPFGGGPHLCIGKPVAMLEASLTLTGLLSRFAFEWPANLSQVLPDPQVTLRPEPRPILRVRAR